MGNKGHEKEVSLEQRKINWMGDELVDTWDIIIW